MVAPPMHARPAVEQVAEDGAGCAMQPCTPPRKRPQKRASGPTPVLPTVCPRSRRDMRSLLAKPLLGGGPCAKSSAVTSCGSWRCESAEAYRGGGFVFDEPTALHTLRGLRGLQRRSCRTSVNDPHGLRKRTQTRASSRQRLSGSPPHSSASPNLCVLSGVTFPEFRDPGIPSSQARPTTQGSTE